MKKGFTLIELMVVVAILGILTATLVPQLASHVNKARLAGAQGTAANFLTTAQAYFADNGTYPCAGHYYGIYGMNGNPAPCMGGALSRYTSRPLGAQDPWGVSWIWHFHPGTCEYTFIMSLGPNKAGDWNAEVAGSCDDDDVCVFMGRPCDMGL